MLIFFELFPLLLFRSFPASGANSSEAPAESKPIVESDESDGADDEDFMPLPQLASVACAEEAEGDDSEEDEEEAKNSSKKKKYGRKRKAAAAPASEPH
ncbi:MAG: hypothetical protein P4M11_07145 [Candidatus Pacebacteria bacterium]|nr:hypothetical protein [Candidatus Paceibacterota bacterium]